jgi:hypothetical protein
MDVNEDMIDVSASGETTTDADAQVETGYGSQQQTSSMPSQEEDNADAGLDIRTNGAVDIQL